MPDAPLAGTLVLDFGMNIAGPYAASILAGFGADVVKVEPPGGDSGRGYQPVLGGVSVLFASMNHDKRYLGLDLRRDGAADVVARLVERADVLIENLRPGKAEELGIDAERCHATNPRLVHCSVEAFYPADGDRPGYDLMVQAESGFLAATGSEEGGPSRTPSSVLDHVTSLWVALGAMGALAGARDRAAVRVTMLDVAMALFNDRAATCVATGEVPRRMGSSLPTTTPHRAYPTADGDIVVGAANDSLYRKLARVLGPPLEGDERFDSLPGRLQHRDELDALVGDALRKQTTAFWLERLEAAGVPAAAVRDLAEAVDRHRRLSATGFHDIPGIPGLSVVAPPVSMVGTWGPPAPGPVGSDSDEVLRDVAGLDDAAIARLREEGIVVG